MKKHSITIKWSNEKTKVILIGLLYWIVLLISYTWSLQNHLSVGYKLNFNFAKCLAASLISIALFFFLPVDDTIVSFFLLLTLYLVVLPMGCIYTCVNGSSIYYFTVASLYIVIEQFVGRLSLKHINLAVHNHFSISKLIIIISVIVVVVTIIALYLERGIPNTKALDFKLVYDIRESYELDSLASSLARISTQVIIPFLVTVGFIKRKWVPVVFLLGTQFVIYLWLAHKSILFSIAIMIIGYFLAKTKKRNQVFSLAFTSLFTFLSVLEGVNGSLQVDINFQIYSLYGILIRRAVFVPAYLKQFYYSYFVTEGNSLAGFFGTIISPVLTRLQVANPYSSISYSKVIGILFSDGSYANTGVFGGELAHFGYLGLFVAAISFLFILLCIKSCEQTSGKVFTCCLSIYSIMSLTNGKAMDIICFSPMLLLCVLLLTFNMRHLDKPSDMKPLVYFTEGSLYSDEK